MKYKVTTFYLDKDINDFKKLIKEYFEWLCNLGDYKDKIYEKFEQDQLPLSIKHDDIVLLQKSYFQFKYFN